MDNEKLIVVLTTVGNEAEATAIAISLVDERLAACVNIVPGLRSIYRWEGAVQDDAELLLVTKTRASLFEKLQARIAALHSYSNPEIVALPAEAVAEKYFSWMLKETEND